MIVKKRVIAYRNKDSEPVIGFTLPNEFCALFENIEYFKIEASGTGILLTSGTNTRPSKEEITSYKFEDCRI